MLKPMKKRAIEAWREENGKHDPNEQKHDEPVPQIRERERERPEPVRILLMFEFLYQ